MRVEKRTGSFSASSFDPGIIWLPYVALMKTRLLQLLSEGITVLPLWKDGKAQLMMTNPASEAEPLARYESFDRATREEFVECALIVRGWLENGRRI